MPFHPLPSHDSLDFAETCSLPWQFSQIGRGTEPRVTQGSDSIHTDIQLDSKLDSVDRGEELVLDAARGIGFDEDELHRIGIAVRESLVNAVTHGNRFHGRKKVHLRVLISPEQMSVEISDEGPGFTQAAVPDPLSAENLLKHSGRGLLMMQAFMDEFSVLPREGAGTLVRMVKKRHQS